MSDIKLLNGDCLELMKDIPNGSIDMILTDPPYLMNYQSDRRKNKHKKIKNDKVEDKEFLSDFYQLSFHKLKKDSAMYVFCSWHHLDYFLQILKEEIDNYNKKINDKKSLIKYKNLLIWIKNNHGSGDLIGDFAPQHELILLITKGRPFKKTKRKPNILYAKKTGNKLHPTQKPVDLCKELIEYFCNENDTVLDPFMGSGTTGVACKELNRKFIGIELDEEYYNIAKERVKKGE